MCLWQPDSVHGEVGFFAMAFWVCRDVNPFLCLLGMICCLLWCWRAVCIDLFGAGGKAFVLIQENLWH